MKLSQYAKQQGISYRTALRWFRDGTIQGYQAPSGTIIVTEQEPVQAVQKVAIYARVSSAEHRENRENLERQAERLSQYCTVRGYQVALIAKEIASGVNDSRPKLLSLLKDTSITRVVVEHRDRLTRFGFHYIDTLFSVQGRVIEVVNPADNDADNDKEELLADLASIIYSFCARLYGQRRAKRKTEKVVQELQAQEEA